MNHPTWRRENGALFLQLEAALLRFDLDGNHLLGLGSARVHDLELIAPGSTRLPFLETRDSWQVEWLELLDARIQGARATLEARVWGTKSGMGRKVDVFGVPYLSTPRRQGELLGILKWHLWSEARAFGREDVRRTDYAGFGYKFEVELCRPFHWIVDAGTWELGGDLEGVRLLSQRIHPAAGPLDFQVSRGGRSFSSAESFVPGALNGATVVPDVPSDPSLGFSLPIQAQLRGAGGQLFDFQCKDGAVLLGLFERPSYIRSLVEWRDGDDGIGHLDHHFFPLTERVTTPAKLILVAQEKAKTSTDALNLWTDAQEEVSEQWRTFYGMKRVEPLNGIGLDCCGTAGRHLGYGPPDVFARWEARFEELKRQGLDYIFVGGIGNHRGHELPGRANMCQPFDYSVVQRYGGPEGFREFCARAHAHGLGVALWMCGHLSDEAPALQDNPDWTISYDDGTPWDGAYRIMRSCALSRGFGNWMFAQFAELKKLGLDLLFFDSYHNLAAMPVDYGHDLAPQADELWRFQAKLEEAGLPMLIESVGPFGLTSCGLWPQYLDAPELLYRTHLRAGLDEIGAMNQALYFRFLAAKAPLGVSVLEQDNAPFGGDLNIPAPVAELNRAFREVAPHMETRTLWPDGSAWWHSRDGQSGALFCPPDVGVCAPEGFRLNLVADVAGAGRILSGERKEVMNP